VSVRVDAVVYFRVVDPIKATVNVQDYMFAIAQQAQTSLRSIIVSPRWISCWLSVSRSTGSCGASSMSRPRALGIRVERVEVKDVSLRKG